MFLSSWAGMAQFLLKQAIPTASPSTPSPPPTQAHSDTTSVGEDEDIELDSEDPIAIVPTDRTYEEGLTPSEGDVSWHTPDEPTEMPAQIVRIVDVTAPSSSSDSSGEEPNQPDDEMEFGDSDSEDMDIVKAQITQMVDMGFSLSQVTNAVHAVGMDVDLLLEHLLANPGFGGDEPGNTLGQHTTNEGHVSAFTLGPAPMAEDAHMSHGMNPPETINHTNPDGNAESSSSVGAKSVTMADTNIVGDVCYEELQALAKRSMELVQMGYSFDQVQAAMTASNLRPDVALEYLKKGLSKERMALLQGREKRYGPAGSSGSTAGRPTDTTPGYEQFKETIAPAMTQMTQMGFSPKDVSEALAASSFNVDLARDHLINGDISGQ